LEFNNYIVDAYSSPREAISKFKANTYDFVLLDIIMPEMNGFEAYEAIKEIDPIQKVCFMTAYDVNYQSLKEIFNLPEIDGAYLKKPIKWKN
jgi:CheY-like chemotaxis protein